jgi:hypothetical protein
MYMSGRGGYGTGESYLKRSFIILLLANIKKIELCRACSTNGREAKSIKNVG